MSEVPRGRRIAGWSILGPVGALMIFSAAHKIFGFTPEPILEAMRKWGLVEEIRWIGLAELTSVVLLLVPRTSSLGLLMASAYWGGAIAIHVAYEEIEFLLPAALLALTWLGAWLRSPEVMASFRRRSGS